MTRFVSEPDQESIDSSAEIKAHEALLEAVKDTRSLESISLLYATYVHERTGHNRTETARRLEVNRKTLTRWGV